MARELTPGAIFEGRFRLERRLGAGGTSTVWLATDEGDLARPHVALKLLHVAFPAGGRAAERLAREASVLLQLRHPNIVHARAFDYGRDGAYLVLDYAEGDTLAEYMQRAVERGAQLSLADVGTLFSQLSAAVEVAHAAGVIHRDLKPHNIIVAETAGGLHVRVLDFGLAKLLGAAAQDETTIGRAVGSYLYMSPEQALGAPVDERTDVFALGTILFELLTLRRAWARRADGRPLLAFAEPFDLEGPNAAPAIAARIARADRPLPSEHRPELPRALDVVVARALAIAPDDRYARVNMLHADLLRALVERPWSSAALAETTAATATEVVDPTPILAGPRDTAPRALPLDVDAELLRVRLPVLGAAPRTPTSANALEPGSTTDVGPGAGADTLTDRTALSPARPERRAPFAAPRALALTLGGAAVVLLGASLLVRSAPPPTVAAPAEVRAPVRAQVTPRSLAVDAAEDTAPAAPDVAEPRTAPAAVKRASPVASARREGASVGQRGGGPASASSSPGAVLAARLDALRRGPGDAAAIAELGRAVMDEAGRLSDVEVRNRVKRLAFASISAGDLAGLEECIRRIRAAEVAEGERSGRVERP